MRKNIIAALFITAAFAVAQQGLIPVKEYDEVTDGATNIVYIGTSWGTKTHTPQKDGNEWQIKRILSVSNAVLNIGFAVGAGTGDATWKSAIWDDRASTNTVYRIAE